MLMITRIITLLVLSLSLSACQTLTMGNDEHDQTIKTAKVNAQLGIAYLEKNNVSRAKQKLSLALEQAPTIPETWYSMAYYLETTGNKAKARDYYLKALQLAPTNGEALNNYGTYLCRTGDYQGAVAHFLRAVKDRHYQTPADAYENAGLCSLKIPDAKQAHQYFEYANRSDNTRPISLIKSAELFYETGDYTTAKLRLSRYLEVSPATQQAKELARRLHYTPSHTQLAKDNLITSGTLPTAKRAAVHHAQPKRNSQARNEKRKKRSAIPSSRATQKVIKQKRVKDTRVLKVNNHRKAHGKHKTKKMV